MVRRCSRDSNLHGRRFHLLHYLALGQSIDSPKRRASQVQPSSPDEDQDDLLDCFESADTVFADVSAREIVSALSKVLPAREMIILHWLSEGLSTREIATRLGISHSMVIKHRRKIAALTQKLSVARPMKPALQSAADSKRSQHS
jgi:DNA-binding CsgD family transcriptional regulator